MMEDCNALISDCIIISCCCECLILQLVIFVFLQLPRKMAKKTKEYAKRKLRRIKKKEHHHDQSEGIIVANDEEFVRLGGIIRGNSSMRTHEIEGLDINELHNWGSCNEEVDKVLGELYMKGEFAFGSFWRRQPEIEMAKSYYKCKCSRNLTKEEALEEFGNHVVKFHLIEVIGPF